ncbi:MAG TPA: reverse transcriptase domain-containing protein, partial [Oculatellaceae cyanobacterium]
MYAIKDMQSEPNHQHQNYAERRIQEVKNTSTIVMDRVKAPNYLWYLCLKYFVDILNHLSTPSLDHKTPIEACFGITTDISVLLQFYFYQPVLYLDTNLPSYPHSKERLGHWVGIAHNVGDALTYKILTKDMTVIARSTMRPAYHPGQENLCQAEGESSGVFMENFKPPAVGPPVYLEPEELHQMPIVDPLMEASKKPVVHIQPEHIVGLQFIKNHNGFPHRAKVTEQMEDGSKYLVALGDGEREEILTYNEIMDYVETQLAQDPDDQAWTFDEVLDHKKNNEGKFEILVHWTTGEETWEPLAWIADQDPITIAEYAKRHNLLDVPGWKRFKRYIENKKKYIRAVRQINAIKKNATKIKFGIEVPRNYKDALRLDHLNGNSLWQNAIKTELDQIMGYQTFVDNGRTAPHGHKRNPVHFVFDVKFDLRRKARLVAGGHLTEEIYNDAPYTGIASIKSIRICIFLAKLNNLQIRTADVGNAYLEAMTKEKLYIVAGPEFGDLEGHNLVIQKVLYGLQTSGARWAERLADSLRAQGFTSSYTDAAIWMKDKDDHWEYICVWVDDMLIISKDTDSILKELEKEYTLKGVGEPKYYLGADMKQVTKPENVFIMSSETYVNRCLVVFEQLFGEPPPKQVQTPIDPKDHPELDSTPLLDEEGIHMYWKLLGMLQWAVTLGRIDIMCAVMTMGGFRMQPRIGHLDRLKKIFGFLKNFNKTAIKFRTEMPDYSQYPEKKFDWTYVYGNVEEELPKEMPAAKGREVLITMFADANLYHDYVTGRS